MAARNIFRVVPNGSRWEVRKDGSILNTFQYRKGAVERATELASKTISSRVIVYRNDGSVIKMRQLNEMH